MTSNRDIKSPHLRKTSYILVCCLLVLVGTCWLVHPGCHQVPHRSPRSPRSTSRPLVPSAPTEPPRAVPQDIELVVSVSPELLRQKLLGKLERNLLLSVAGCGDWWCVL